MADDRRWRFWLREIMIVVAVAAMGMAALGAVDGRDRWVAFLWAWLMVPVPACALSWWRTLQARRRRRAAEGLGQPEPRFRPMIPLRDAPDEEMGRRQLDAVVQILANVLGVVWLLTLSFAYSGRRGGFAGLHLIFVGLLLATILILSVLDGAWLRAGAIVAYLATTVALFAALS